MNLESGVSRSLQNAATYLTNYVVFYRDSDKSLARPGRKQARKRVRDARDFNNIETRAVIIFFSPARQSAQGNSRHSDRNISFFPSWSVYGLISTRVFYKTVISIVAAWRTSGLTDVLCRVTETSVRRLVKCALKYLVS